MFPCINYFKYLQIKLLYKNIYEIRKNNKHYQYYNDIDSNNFYL